MEIINYFNLLLHQSHNHIIILIKNSLKLLETILLIKNAKLLCFALAQRQWSCNHYLIIALLNHLKVPCVYGLFINIFTLKDHDILADFSSNSKKLIALEVVETLSLRFIEALYADEAVTSPIMGKPKQPTSLPVLLEPIPSTGNALWKLPTWKHVKWTAHSIAPVFTLSLESLNSISNAVKIYCLWLKNPNSRPAGVNDSNLEEFVSVKHKI